jgi:type I restriction enzyme S subunit
MEFEASFIDPLNLPIDWKVLGFPDLVFFQEGPGIRNWQYVERDGVRFVNIRCLEDGRLITSKMSQISKEEAYGKYSHFLLDADDYVVSSSGTLG